MSAFRVVSYNIRHAVLDDGPNAWSRRREAVLDLLDALSPAVVGLQESTGDQHAEVESGLPGYGWAGVADDPGNGEHNPIGVGSRFDIHDAGTMWLSETPDVPGSVGWDGSFARAATRVDLRDETTGRELSVFNAHFDHEGPTARERSAALLRDRVRSLPPAREAVVMGDLNCRPGSNPYDVLARDDGLDQGDNVDANGTLADTRAVAEDVSGPETTVTSFTALDPDRRLDHVFVTSGLAVERYRACDHTDDSGRYPSDHLPVVVRLRFDEGDDRTGGGDGGG
jgi:endonuclease/exonuclease/phosphatase family metal-dependent hydrolase